MNVVPVVPRVVCREWCASEVLPVVGALAGAAVVRRNDRTASCRGTVHVTFHMRSS